MRTREGLKQLQQLPLSIKVSMSITRIRQWVSEYGEDGVYVAYSGWKDSTVLSHLVDKAIPGNEIPRVFFNTGLEYPEIVQFVKREPRAVLIRPKMNFKKVIEKYGYPFISKEISQNAYEARKGQQHALDRYNAEGAYKDSLYALTRWKFLNDDDAPRFSHMCCIVMKKTPAHQYEKDEHRYAMTGEQARESMRRTTNWLKVGCNGFQLKHPKSTPMAFWMENDVLQYIKENNLEVASVYGDIVADTRNEDVAYGQMRIEDFFGGDCKLRTTGCTRTGCMFCGYGCHLEKPGEGRYLKMKETHPKLYEYIMKPWDQGGLGYKEVIDWINEHGGFHIEY